MSTIKARTYKSPTRNFSTVLNEPFEFKSPLTLKARGLLMTALIQSPEWEFKLDHMAKVLPEGKDAIRSGFDELERAKYLIRATGRNETGYFAYHYIFFNSLDERKDWEMGLTEEEKRFWLTKPLNSKDLNRVGLSDAAENDRVGLSDADKPYAADPTRLNRCGEPDPITNNKETNTNQTNTNQTKTNEQITRTPAHDLYMPEVLIEKTEGNHAENCLENENLPLVTVEAENVREENFSAAPKIAQAEETGLVHKTDPFFERESALSRQKKIAIAHKTSGTIFETVETEDEFFKLVRAYKIATDPTLNHGKATSITQAVVRRIKTLEYADLDPSDRELLTLWKDGELNQYQGERLSKQEELAQEIYESLKNNPYLDENL